MGSVGLIPTVDNAGPNLPTPVVGTWRHRHAYLATPLILPGWEARVLDSWTATIREDHGPLALAYLDWSDRFGPVYQAARAMMGRTVELDAFERPYWSRDSEPIGGGGKRRKQLRRLHRRLQEKGPVEIRRLACARSADDVIDIFLRLERSGWKGAQGTALACRDDDRAFFEALVRQAAKAGSLLAHGLYVGDTPIAMNVDFRSGPLGVCLKTSYDVEWARYSPGLQLERLLLEALTDGPVEALDSCASRDNQALSAIWPETRPIGELLLCADSWVSRGLLTSLDLVRQVRRA